MQGIRYRNSCNGVSYRPHVHLFLNALPNIAPSDIMHRIKGTSSGIIRKEFSKMPSLWTRSYFVSTAGNASSETVKKNIDEQKTR